MGPKTKKGIYGTATSEEREDNMKEVTDGFLRELRDKIDSSRFDQQENSRYMISTQSTGWVFSKALFTGTARQRQKNLNDFTKNDGYMTNKRGPGTIKDEPAIKRGIKKIQQDIEEQKIEEKAAEKDFNTALDEAINQNVLDAFERNYFPAELENQKKQTENFKTAQHFKKLFEEAIKQSANLKT